ncbi:uncharacterized protein [Centruroides vittatus]|uniref:uncharacterized protein n=1 Tax=Centruroides vittatus TaxID=120091 RepID=UPI003510A5A4
MEEGENEVEKHHRQFYDENNYKVKSSNVDFDPYPVVYKEYFLVSMNWEFLQPVTCNTMFLLTIVEHGKKKYEAGKQFTFSMKQVMSTSQNCTIDKKAYYSCLENDPIKKMQNGNNIQPGSMYVCSKLPSMFKPGVYDVFIELKVNGVTITCFKLSNVKIEDSNKNFVAKDIEADSTTFRGTVCAVILNTNFVYELALLMSLSMIGFIGIVPAKKASDSLSERLYLANINSSDYIMFDHSEICRFYDKLNDAWEDTFALGYSIGMLMLGTFVYKSPFSEENRMN